MSELDVLVSIDSTLQQMATAQAVYGETLGSVSSELVGFSGGFVFLIGLVGCGFGFLGAMALWYMIREAATHRDF